MKKSINKKTNAVKKSSEPSDDFSKEVEKRLKWTNDFNKRTGRPLMTFDQCRKLVNRPNRIYIPPGMPIPEAVEWLRKEWTEQHLKTRGPRPTAG